MLDAEGLIDRLCGGESGYGERPGGGPGDALRLVRELCRRRQQLRRPGALAAQRQRVGEHLVPRREAIDRVSDVRHDAGGLDAERHRRTDADVPVAPADDVVPVGDTGGPDFDQHFVAGGRRRVGHVDQLNRTTQRLDPGHAHGGPTTCRSGARRARG